MNIVRTCFLSLVILLQGMSLLAMQPELAVDLVGVYERRCDGDHLFVVKNNDFFYLADAQVMRKLYLVCANDGQLNFVGWGMGVAFVIEKDSENGAIDLIILGEDSVGSRVYTRDKTKVIPREFYTHEVFSFPVQPYEDVLSFCAGMYQGSLDEFSGFMFIEQRDHRLFLRRLSLTLKQIGNEFELFPQVSTENVPEVACFYAVGCNIFFELDLDAKTVKSMNVFTRSNEGSFEKIADDVDTGPADDEA